ncbi:hypothetical protein TUMEXPCC7403_18775 [Tumidithrix helvetica PCC 7403]
MITFDQGSLKPILLTIFLVFCNKVNHRNHEINQAPIAIEESQDFNKIQVDI